MILRGNAGLILKDEGSNPVTHYADLSGPDLQAEPSINDARRSLVLTLICDLRWVRGSLSTNALKRYTNQEQMHYYLVTQSPPCLTTSVVKATSQVSSVNSQVCISVHMAPILQMGHGNLISLIQTRLQELDAQCHSASQRQQSAGTA